MFGSEKKSNRSATELELETQGQNSIEVERSVVSVKDRLIEAETCCC